MKLRVSKLTQEKVDKWNDSPLDVRDTVFRMLNAGWKDGLVTPRPLWKAGKIVLAKESPPEIPR